MAVQKDSGSNRKEKHKYLKYAVAFVTFTVVLLIVVYVVNRTLVPKYRYDDERAQTETYLGFYEMEKDSIDVLLLGSSQMAAGINPQDMYDSQGIRSYNLAGSEQALWISYYWLKEALQYQSPKVVVLECYMLYRDESSNETKARMALDDMRWGSVKREAVATVCSLDDSQSALSYLLTNIRYHTRWLSLNEDDFTWADLAVPSLMKGFWKYWDICGDESYVPLDYSEAEPEAFLDLELEYLDKITSLCEENGIELILIKTPTHAQTDARHNAMQNYADEHGLDFYDFNEIDLYEAVDFDYASDMHNSSTTGTKNAHTNPSGARKLSYYLAEVLVTDYGVVPTDDSQYEETSAFNTYMWNDFLLTHEEDLVTYLEMLDQERYSIFISVKDEASNGLADEMIQAMQALGLDFELEGNYRYSYLAVIDDGEITELMDDETLETHGTIRDGKVNYFVTSAGYGSGNESSIVIDGTEYSQNLRGLNIVVYDNAIKTVIDSVCFDTCLEEYTVTR